MMVGIPFWSFCLSRLWKLDYMCSAAFIVYGIVVGARFVLYRSANADKQSCKLYSVSGLTEFENYTYLLIASALVYHCALTPWLLAIFLQCFKLKLEA
jgi:hypothetical protein